MFMDLMFDIFYINEYICMNVWINFGVSLKYVSIKSTLIFAIKSDGMIYFKLLAWQSICQTTSADVCNEKKTLKKH